MRASACTLNVWTYAGATSFGVTRDTDLAMHPTVKPVAMMAVLDCFAGSGSTPGRGRENPSDRLRDCSIQSIAM